MRTEYGSRQAAAGRQLWLQQSIPFNDIAEKLIPLLRLTMHSQLQSTVGRLLKFTMETLNITLLPSIIHIPFPVPRFLNADL